MNGIAREFSGTQMAMSYLAAQYGTADWNSYEYIRQEFWSFQPYLEAGGISYTFFGQTPGGTVTQADTNMQTAGVFQGGQHFLVEAIRCSFRIPSLLLGSWTGADSTSLASDLLNGFAQAGVLSWQINARNYLTLPQPFLMAPPAVGQVDMHGAGGVSATVSAGPIVTLNNYRESEWVLQPQVLIEAGQSFQFSIEFPSGIIPVIATGITDNTTNPLKIGVTMSGQLFRPTQ